LGNLLVALCARMVKPHFGPIFRFVHFLFLSFMVCQIQNDSPAPSSRR
jgi:hypothetical protein